MMNRMFGRWALWTGIAIETVRRTAGARTRMRRMLTRRVCRTTRDVARLRARSSRPLRHPRQHGLEQRRHPPELTGPDHQIPRRLELLPTRRVEEVLRLVLRRSMRQRRARDRRPAIELAIGPVVARFDLRRG